MDYRAWGFWLVVGQMVVNFCFWVWLFIDRKNKATNVRVDEVVTRVEIVEKELIKVEGTVGNLLNKNDLNNINLTMQQLHGELHELKGTLGGVNRAVDLMNQHLINQGGNK